MILLETRSRTQVHTTCLSYIATPPSLSSTLGALDALPCYPLKQWPMAVSGGDKWNGGYPLHRRGRRGISNRYLLQESSAEVELSDVSLRIQTPQRVGVDDAHIDEPPCE